MHDRLVCKSAQWSAVVSATFTLAACSDGADPASGEASALGGARTISDAGTAAPADASARKTNWLQFGGSPRKDNWNRSESVLATHNVSKLAPLFVTALPSMGDGAPAVLTGAKTVAGMGDVVFFQTEHSHALALDAYTGMVVWRKNLPTGCFRYSDSAMAVDPGLQYVYAVGTDCKVHKLAVFDGTEVVTGGWPQTVATNTGQKVTSELSWATDATTGRSYLYTTISFGGKSAPGSITAIDLESGAKTIWYFHRTGGADAWNRAGVVYDPDRNQIFSATADGAFNPAGGNWSMTLSEINVDATSHRAGGFPNDSFTPSNWAKLSAADLDLGSTNVLVLPPVPGSKIAHLGMQSGKSATIWLLNLDNLSGAGAPGHTGGEIESIPMPQGQGRLGVMGQPAAWMDPADGSVWAFYGSDAGIAGIRVVADATGRPTMQPAWHVSRSPVQSPIVANGVLYYASGGSQSDAIGAVYAADATTGQTLWSAPIAQHHWSSPVVVNGVVYMPDGNGADQGSGNTGTLRAWALPGHHEALDVGTEPAAVDDPASDAVEP